MDKCAVVWIGLVFTFFSTILISSSSAVDSRDHTVQLGLLPCSKPGFSRVDGVRQLAWELMKRTSMQAELEAYQVDPNGPDMFQTPFLLWSCMGSIASLGDGALNNLKHFLKLGGFLWIDDPSANPGGEFDRSVRSFLKGLLPDKTLFKLPYDHVLYKTYYIVDRISGRVHNKSLEGIQFPDGRLAVVYSSNDLLGAISRDLYGNWKMPSEPGGELKRDMSFRLGINIFYYATCLDYKDDAVHLPFILKRRRQ